MYIFSPQSNGDMFVEGFQKLFLQDFPQKIAFFILTPPALGAATWIKSRFDIGEKRKERVRRIADAAEILRLRRELEGLTDSDRDWPTIQRLKPLVADFATTQLRRIESELLKVDPAHGANSSTKGAFSRLLLLYVPVRPWLWIVHCAYYISIMITAIAIFAFFANLPGKPDQVGAYIGSACFFFALGGAPLALPGSIANYFDAKFQGYVPTRRRNIFKRIGLMYRPASIWIWPFQVMFYLTLISSISFGLIGLFAAASWSLLLNLVDLVILMRSPEQRSLAADNVQEEAAANVDLVRS